MSATPLAVASSPASSPTSLTTGPAAAHERVGSIDVVRGLAVLGILVMNVVEFAWPEEAYNNPAYAGGTSGADLWTFYVQTALFDGRMRALFSMLFGAGLVLLAERMVRRGDGARATDVLLRRCLWLVPFGIAHRFFLQWTGDILYQYGLLGALAVAFRNLSARTLLVLGVVWLLACVPTGLRRHAQSVETQQQAAQAAELQQRGEAVPAPLAAAQRRWRAREESVPPTADQLRGEIDRVRVGYWQLFRNRWDYHHTFQSAYLYYVFVFDVLGMMLLGMGLLKTGFFHGTWRTRSYVLTVACGAVAAAMQLVWAMAWQARGFDPVALDLRLIHDLTYAHGRAIVGMAWAAALLLVLRAGWLHTLTNAFGAVGRMAFSCYILQTVCCSLLFYGYGLAWFGTLSRSELMVVVAAVSLLQLVVSVAWLRWFRFGPLEWAWRSLVWWRWQPLRAAKAG